MEATFGKTLHALLHNVLGMQDESQVVIDQLRDVNHEIYCYSSLASLREAVDALDVERLCNHAAQMEDLAAEMEARLEEAEKRARRLNGLLVCIPRLCAWKHRALTAYYAPRAAGGKRLRQEYDTDFCH